MSILPGLKKYKKYKKTKDGYELQSQWTSSQTVEMNDGNTAETNLGAIKGITDSLTATNSNVALSASAGKSLQDQITTVNNNLANLDTSFSVLVDLSGTPLQPTNEYITIYNGNVNTYHRIGIEVWSDLVIGNRNYVEVSIGVTQQGIYPCICSGANSSKPFRTMFIILNETISIFITDNPIYCRIFGIK